MLNEDKYRSTVPAENIESRSGLIPEAFNTIPGFGQFAYSTVANAWILSEGRGDYLETLESDLTITVLNSDVDDRFSPPAIANAALAIGAARQSVTEHFMKVAPHRSNITSMMPVKVTALRAVWEIEYE